MATIQMELSKLKNTTLAYCSPGSSFVEANVRSRDMFFAWSMQHGMKVYPVFSKSPYVHIVRNTILGGGDLPLFKGHIDYTHILWVDSDIQYLPIDFALLLQADLPIVCGGYMMSPRTYSVSVDDDNMIMRSEYEKLAEPGELFEVKWSGLGFMLVEKGVFEKLPSPWFMSPDLVGEDVAFCRAARKAGYTIWCEPKCELTHHKIQPLTPELPYKDVPAIVKLLIREIGQEKLEEIVHGERE